MRDESRGLETRRHIENNPPSAGLVRAPPEWLWGSARLRDNYVDAHYERARGRGTRIDREPAGQSHGQRDYGARDPEGHRSGFGTRLK